MRVRDPSNTTWSCHQSHLVQDTRDIAKCVPGGYLAEGERDTKLRNGSIFFMRAAANDANPLRGDKGATPGRRARAGRKCKLLFPRVNFHTLQNAGPLSI
jgi:hypothetical protein